MLSPQLNTRTPSILQLPPLFCVAVIPVRVYLQVANPGRSFGSQWNLIRRKFAAPLLAPLLLARLPPDSQT